MQHKMQTNGGGRVALLMVVTIVSLSVIVWGQIGSIQTQALDLARHEYQQQQRVIAKQVSMNMTQMVRDVDFALDAVEPPHDPITADSAWLQTPDPRLWALALHDQQGHLLHASPNASPALHQSWEPEVVRAIVEDGPGGAYHPMGVVLGSKKLKAEGGLYVSAIVNPESLQTRWMSHFQKSHQAYAWVVHSDGTIISAPDAAGIGARPFALLPQEVASIWFPLWEKMQQGQAGVGRFLWQDHQEQMSWRLMAWEPVSGVPGWVVAHSVNEDHVIAEVATLQHTTQYTLWFLIAGLCMLCGLTLWWARASLRRQRHSFDLLAAMEARYRATLDHAADLLLSVDIESGKVVMCNQAARKALGECEGAFLWSLHPGAEDEIHQALQAFGQGQNPGVLKLPLGTEHQTVSVNATRVQVMEESFILWSMRDISQQEQMQQRMLHMERLSTMGTLTASVAHEIKTPLATMDMNLYQAREELEYDDADLPELRAMIEGISKAVGQVKSVVVALGNFGRSKRADATRMDLREVVQTAVVLGGARLRGGVRIERTLEGSLWVKGVSAELVQVLLNLLVNAAQACRGHGGQVWVRDVSDDGFVCLEIEDNGPGIPPEVQPRLFEAFFTTKSEGEGTGLGLSISHEIVSNHDGELSFESQPGKTVFQVKLPRWQAQHVLQEERSSHPTSQMH